MLKDKLLKFFKIEGFVQNLGNYIETRVELLKLELKEEVIKSVSKLSLIFVLALFFFISFLFLSVALAFWIGTVAGNTGGFAIVGGLYLLLGATLLIFKEQINHSLEKKIIEVVNKK